MKKILLILVSALLIVACNDAFDLEVVNENEPTLETLNTEQGVKNFAQGFYQYMGAEYLWFAYGYHEVMGDGMFIPWGNYGNRWANQVHQIILDDGTVVDPPQGGTQAEEMRKRNVREQGDNNAYMFEWSFMYKVNNAANALLDAISKTEFSGDSETKAKAATAWALWWKAYAYSRIGSMYSEGLIIDEVGVTNNDYVPNTQIITEANAKFDELTTVLNSLQAGGAYDEMLGAFLPGLLGSDIPTPDEWKRNVNTMKARNLMVNKKVASSNASDWNAIKALVENGVQEDDFVFTMRDDATFLDNSWLIGLTYWGWYFPSERLIQDFRTGDARLAKNFALMPEPSVNVRGRGIQYGTRYEWVDVTAGGTFSTASYNVGIMYFAGTYEENQLMLAETKIRTGSVEDGLAHLDAVRTFQESGLAATVGTSLTEAQAIEELRSERRISLMARSIAFYDARRWGVTEPLSQGGGRTGVVVIDDAGNLNTNATFDYNYLDYWDVPQNETDFNPNSASPQAGLR